MKRSKLSALKKAASEGEYVEFSVKPKKVGRLTYIGTGGNIDKLDEVGKSVFLGTIKHTNFEESSFFIPPYHFLF